MTPDHLNSDANASAETASRALGFPERRPAVFLDRDGTINREVDYLSRPEDMELIPGAGDALRQLADAGYLLCVVTNQSGIARGMFDEATLHQIHARLDELLVPFGVTFDWVGYCPHHPTVGDSAYAADCSCRKPKPGLMLRANAALAIDLGRSWCVGDSLRDLDAAARVGVPGLLVRTGKGAAQERVAAERGDASIVVDDLSGAAKHILGR